MHLFKDFPHTFLGPPGASNENKMSKTNVFFLNKPTDKKSVINMIFRHFAYTDAIASRMLPPPKNKAPSRL